jgi:hypothetical protein
LSGCCLSVDTQQFRKIIPLTPGMKSLRATLPAEIFYWGFLTFKGLTARRLYTSFGVKGLTLSNPIFLPPAYFPALIYFGRERGWWVTCNYPIGRSPTL